MTQVTLHHLQKSFAADSAVVDDLSLTLPCGQITALLGPSGCGKTTTLKLIAGLLPVDQGDIQFDGKSILGISAERRGAVMVFQNHLLFPTMTVGENVGFGLKMRDVDKATIRQKVADMLTRVKLPGMEDRRATELSGGQKQRVALARALVVEPNVLLLDEPLSNLDAHLRDEMRELILSLQRQMGITTLVVTHDQQEAVILADQIGLMFDGKLHQVGAPRDFYQRPANRRVARFFGGVNFLHGTKEAQTFRVGDATFHLATCALPDGPALATIRPENIEPWCDPRPNTISGTIVDKLYLGTHARYKVDLPHADAPFEVTAPSASYDSAEIGDPIFLHLPPRELWLMADEPTRSHP